MTENLFTELTATCSSVGYFDAKTNKYYADGNTLETVKDLVRYLRRDDEKHSIRRYIGHMQILQTDLVPLLKNYWEETELFDVLLRLLVNLTSPALILWNEDIPKDKIIRNYYLQIEDHHQKYKQVFADTDVWTLLSAKLGKILESDFSVRGNENNLIIERILMLIRNILHIPSNLDKEKKHNDDVNTHDQVLWALHHCGMLDIILFIASSATETSYYIHILEILFLLLREQSASKLAPCELQRNKTEKLKDEAELLAIRDSEHRQKQLKVKKYSGARHSHFGGTFIVKSLKSISDSDLIYHKPLNDVESINFSIEKRKPKIPRNRLPAQNSCIDRRSAFSIRLFLKEFCIEFLNGAYNTFMYNIKDSLVREKVEVHDESYYLWALKFFMEFNRCYKFKMKLVSETMSIQSFHFVQTYMESYFDSICMDKKRAYLWAKRLHFALLAYRELLLTICVMDKSCDEAVRKSANIIKSNLFYVVEYREFIITLLTTYDELVLPHAYLINLIETQHIFLKMFQVYCEKHNDIIVQKKIKPKKKRKTASKIGNVPVEEINAETLWDEIAPQVIVVLEDSSCIPQDIVPFDATSEISMDEQKSEAMKNIHRLLRNNEIEQSVGLLRAAREVWPENDDFGSTTIIPEEELLALRDIFLADFGKNNLQLQTAVDNTVEGNEELDNEELDDHMDTSEINIKFADFSKRLAHPRIVRTCGLALRKFEINTAEINHCIIKLLHRIAFDNNMYAMIFQASIFRTFQKICARKDMPQHKELVKFVSYIMQCFFKVTQKNPKIFMEVLFWKSSRDAYDVEEGYGSYQEQLKTAKKGWTEDEENELRVLFIEHQEKNIPEDVINWIIVNLIDNTRTRKAVIKKLKEMYLLVNYKNKPKKNNQWLKEEQEQLKLLYEQFKNAKNSVKCIMDQLIKPRSRKDVVQKLITMELITDINEIKKQVKQTQKSHNLNVELEDNEIKSSESDNTASDSDDGSNNINRRTGAITHQRKKNTRQKISKQKTRSSCPLSNEVLLNLLKNVINIKDALEWLKECMLDTANDLEDNPDDCNEGVPLVPISETAISAFDNENFKKLLLGFGIVEPYCEQEIYWRIPSNLTASILHNHCKLITDFLENTNMDDPTENNDDSSDEDVFEFVRRIMEHRKQVEHESSSNSNSQNLKSSNKIFNNDNINVNVNSSGNDKSNTSFDEDSQNVIDIVKNKVAKRKLRIVDSDSETDCSNTINADFTESKRQRDNSDSESQTQRTKRSKMIVSDDEDGDI